MTISTVASTPVVAVDSESSAGAAPPKEVLIDIRENYVDNVVRGNSIPLLEPTALLVNIVMRKSMSPSLAKPGDEMLAMTGALSNHRRRRDVVLESSRQQ